MFCLIFLFYSGAVVAEVRGGYQLAWLMRFQIIEGIAAGINYLHQYSRLRAIHGDIKSANILLDCEMTPRITDFGIAHVLSADEDEKDLDCIVGTL